MLFIVPDSNAQTPSAGASPAGGPPKPGGTPASSLPTGSPGAAKAPSFKVELDLDDAPFLEEPLDDPGLEESAAAPAASSTEAPLPMAATKAEKVSIKEKFRILLARLLADKKRLVIVGGAAVLLIVGAVAVNIFLFPKKPVEQAPDAARPAEPRRVVVNSTAPADPGSELPRFIVAWEPFLIERRGSEGELRFLRCRFSVPTDNPMLNAELQGKKVALRDAVYYYLNNRSLILLSDTQKQTEMKADLISVINEHVSSGKIADLYIEEYMVSGP